MGLGILVVFIILVAIFIIKGIISFSLRVIGLGILIALIFGTIWVCSEKPELHKPISVNTIEYLFKINKDGSMTTTKQITQTVFKEQGVNANPSAELTTSTLQGGN